LIDGVAGDEMTKKAEAIWFNSNSQPHTGSTAVVLHKRTEERAAKRRKIPGILGSTMKKRERKRRKKKEKEEIQVGPGGNGRN
jgi:hypothetical protein